MRIISGSARGRKLKEPSGVSIRPTGDKVKESIFNIVQFDIEGRSVLDLFAGTGQLGIEALSRGATRTVFVDSSVESVKLIKTNLNLSGFSDRAEIYARDALKFIGSREKFDLIFADPPYDNEKIYEQIITKIYEFDKLNVNGIIILEMSAAVHAPPVSAPYVLAKEYKYGGSKIVKYIKES
jgi:16S rRNA (guanine(966)-N(2))-methyltransferase RsmD